MVSDARLSRSRRLLGMSAVLAGGALATALVGSTASVAAVPSSPPGGVRAASESTQLPVQQIEKIERADGTFSSGVLTIDINRSDLHVHGLHGVRFKTGFEIQHELYFQSLGRHRAAFNGSVAVKQSEIAPVIDEILKQGLTFQAEHQHYTDLSPMVWFIHFRGTGEPRALAEKVHTVVRATSTPLPQSSPKHPTTPLPAKRLAAILGGEASVGDNGVVTVDVPRRHSVVLGGHRINPGLGVQTNISFEPYGGGDRAVVAPDFAMTTNEITPVTRIMRSHGWEDGCLYNQETGESPQLFFSHMVKTGDAVTLAHQIRRALDHTDVEPS